MAELTDDDTGCRVSPDLPLVIFDCDGVLIDSDRISLRVQAEHLTAIGLPTTYDDCVRDFLGIGMSSSLELIEERLGQPIPADWLSQLSEAVQDALAAELEPVAGIMEALAAIPHRMCVASSTGHEQIEFRLRHTGLYEQFAGHIYSGEDVEHGKPAPDLFLAAAASEQADPARCVVVEDSPAGVQAAGAARMPVLAYAAETPRERLAGADRVFTDMTELPRLIEEVLAADAAAE